MSDAKKKESNHERGVWAENRAALYLSLRGYTIIAKRYKTKFGEIDLIASKSGVLIIAEVKARKRLEDALESVNVKTQRRIANATLCFLAEHPAFAEHAIRFDVIAIENLVRIVHLDNAWEAGP